MSTPEVDTPTTEAEDLSLDLVKEATSPLAKYLANGGVKYASKVVNVYTDLQAQLEINEAETNLERLRREYEKEMLGGIVDGEEDDNADIAALKLKIADLQQQKWNTRLEVTMHTVAGKIMQAIAKSMQAKQKKYGWTNERHNEIYMKHFWRYSIKSVKVVETGEEFAGPLSLEDYDDFMETLPETQIAKIYDTAELLTRAIEMADDKIDAGFPSRVPELAGKP